MQLPATDLGVTGTWRYDMKILERNGFIKNVSIGGQQDGYILVVHPTAVVERLRRAGRLPIQSGLSLTRTAKPNPRNPRSKSEGKRRRRCKK